jgi:hypothetical protein
MNRRSLPDSGQDSWYFQICGLVLLSVSSSSPLRPQQQPLFADLLAHLTRTSVLGPGEAARVVAEVLTYFSETANEFVQRRHGELQARGLTNDQIFARIAAELPARRVVAPELSVRQLRRIVYG